LQDQRHHQQLDFLSQTTLKYRKILKVRGYTVLINGCTNNNTHLKSILPFGCAPSSESYLMLADG